MKNLILYLFLLISTSSYSQKSLELASTFAPDKQLVEVNFYKWKKSGFGCHLGIQVGNYGNRVYDSINKDFLGHLLFIDGYKSFQIKHNGLLIGLGINYNKKIDARFSYRLQIGLKFGFENSSYFGIKKKNDTDTDYELTSGTLFRLHAAVQYDISLSYLITKKIGVTSSILIPFYFPITNRYATTGNKNDDWINIGFEPAFSIGVFYQWR